MHSNFHFKSTVKETANNPNKKMDDNVEDINLKIAHIDTAKEGTMQDYGTGDLLQANKLKYTPHANEGALNQFKVGEYLDGVKMDTPRIFGSSGSHSVRDSIASQDTVASHDTIDSVNLEEDPFSDDIDDLSGGYSRQGLFKLNFL